MLKVNRVVKMAAGLSLLFGCEKGSSPPDVADPTEPPAENEPVRDATHSNPLSSESQQSPSSEAGTDDNASPAETADGAGGTEDADGSWQAVAISAASAEEDLRRLFRDHVAGLTESEVEVVSRAVLLHARMDEPGLAALVQECGGSFEPPSTPQSAVDMADGSILADSIVAGRDRLRGDPRFGIPNPGPVAMLQDWMFGVVIHSDSSGAVTLPVDIAQTRTPAVIVAVPIEIAAQRIALVITFIEVDGRLIPYRSDCFATQTGDNEVFPLMRPLL